MRPKVLIPLALMAATGGMGAGALGGLKGAALGTASGTGGSLAGALASGAAGGASLPTAGWLGTGGKLALGKGTLAKGIMSGLANPLSKKGLMTYGGLASLGMGLLGDKGEKTKDPIDRKALNQANYNMMRMYGQNAGYTNEDINTIYGPLGEMMGGEYTTVAADPNQRRRVQFPGTNYPIYTTQGAANGCRIGYSEGDAVKKGIVVEGDSVKEFDDSGSYIPRSYRRIGLDGDLFVDNSGYESLRHPPNSDFTVGGLEEQYRQQDEYRKKYNNARGDIREVTQPALQEYFDTYSSVEGAMEKAIIRRKLADIAKKYKFDRLASYQKPNEEFIERIMKKFDHDVDLPSQMNTGGRIYKNMGGIMNAGSIPQTMQNPADMNMQLDGRGGGFIPMGAKPKADDVPAMLSKDEFVMTRDAVKGMGGGDANVGAQRMYDLMNQLEAKV